MLLFNIWKRKLPYTSSSSSFFLIFKTTLNTEFSLHEAKLVPFFPPFVGEMGEKGNHCFPDFTSQQENGVAEPRFWYLTDQIQLKHNSSHGGANLQLLTGALVILSLWEEPSGHSSAPEKLFPSIFLISSSCYPCKFPHEYHDQGVWGASLLGLLLRAAYPWCSLASGLFVLASSSKMFGNSLCSQSILGGMEGGPETSFLKSNTTKNPIGNLMREIWYPKPVVWYPAVSIPRLPCTS